MDEEMAEIYRQLADRISQEEFQSRVDEKVSLMGGLCDPKTAAMLVARDLGAGEVSVKIGRIKPESGTVSFAGRIVAVSPVREFKRSDGSTGRVAGITLADETGSVRVTLWDEKAELVRSGELHVDQCLSVRGMAKEGYSGTEVNIGSGGGFQEIGLDIQPRVSPHKISEISRDMGDLNLIGQVIDPGYAREFVRTDMSRGFVRTVILGDETGKIPVTLWDESAKMEVHSGEVLEILNATSRERYGHLEISTGRYSTVRRSECKVQYHERMTPIADLQEGMVCSISGFVTEIGHPREFKREDGKTGRVVNIYISDEEGNRVRAALWGDHVDRVSNVDLGYRAVLMDCQVKSGWNEEIEVSCGWRSRITFAPPGKES